MRIYFICNFAIFKNSTFDVFERKLAHVVSIYYTLKPAKTEFRKSEKTKSDFSLSLSSIIRVCSDRFAYYFESPEFTLLSHYQTQNFNYSREVGYFYAVPIEPFWLCVCSIFLIQYVLRVFLYFYCSCNCKFSFLFL